MVTFDDRQIDYATTQSVGLKLINVKNTDPETFVVLSDFYTKDKNHVYYR